MRGFNLLLALALHAAAFLLTHLRRRNTLFYRLFYLCAHASKQQEEYSNTANMIVDPVQAFGMSDMLMKTTTGLTTTGMDLLS